MSRPLLHSSTDEATCNQPQQIQAPTGKTLQVGTARSAIVNGLWLMDMENHVH